MGDGQIRVIAELGLQPGSREEVERLAGAAADYVAEHEPGTLAYDWYVSPDGSAARVDEIYDSSEALLAHLGGRAATEILKPLAAHLTGMTLDVLGPVSDELVAATKGAPFTYYGARVAGFDR